MASRLQTTTAADTLPVVHPGRLLGREMRARDLNASELARHLAVSPTRITDIVAGRRGITADTALRLGRYLGTTAQFWLDLRGQYEIATTQRARGAAIIADVVPADAA